MRISDWSSDVCSSDLANFVKTILAVGLNYVDHAAESGFAVPEAPIVFTKFASSITGPFGDLALTGDSVDWEVELVAVIGIGGRNIPAENALDHVAGFTVGQDYSDRAVQFLGAPAQFSLGKAFPGFAIRKSVGGGKRVS